jgi:hypothetical protein
MILRMLFVGLIFILAIVPTFFYLGPTIEARLLPVLELQATDLRYDTITYQGEKRVRAFFKTHIVKKRPCELEVFSFRWLLDHNVAVTPVFVAEDGLPFQPSSVITIGEFTSRELWTLIPLAAFNYPTATFRGTAYFRCHGLWPLAFYFELPVKIPNLEDKRSEVRKEKARQVSACRDRRQTGCG